MSERISSPWAWLETPPPHLKAYHGGGVWDERTIFQQAAGLAEQDPDFVVLIDGDISVTREQAVLEAEALSSALYARGLRPGDVIAFQLPNWREAMVINLAAALSGLIVNPIVPIYRDHEVSLMLSDCRARAFFVAGEFRNYDYADMAARVQARLPDLRHIFTVRGDGANDFAALVEEGRSRRFARPKVDPLGVKMVLYTSGTTGLPKGVLHSHVAISHILKKSGAYWGMEAGEATLVPSPVTHISGYANGLEAPFVCGTRTILMESWVARSAVDLIEKHNVVGTVAATPFLVELAAAARESGKALPSLRYFACGGAAVPPDLIPAANAAFANLRAFRVFGASEVPLVTFGWPRDERLAASTDGAIVDYAVRVVGDDGWEVPDGREGEILARGPGMMLGYADAEQTREAITADGYFRTGDLGTRTTDGALIITGRKKDLIIRGGENISAKEIEDALHLHPQVQEAAVVAMPHVRLGEGICAFVIPAGGEAPPADDLAAHIAAYGLAKQKIPERFEFRDQFPRTASGKVRKDLLRAEVQQIIKLAP